MFLKHIDLDLDYKLKLQDSLARIHKGGLSTNLGFRTSYDAFLHVFFTNLVCKEQKEVWQNKKEVCQQTLVCRQTSFVNSGVSLHKSIRDPRSILSSVRVTVLGLSSHLAVLGLSRRLTNINNVKQTTKLLLQ